MNADCFPQRRQAYWRAAATGRCRPLSPPALDARWFQILFLASFCALGALARDFALTGQQVALTFVAAIVTQAAWQWGLGLPNRKGWSGYLSAIVSSFGISIWCAPIRCGCTRCWRRSRCRRNSCCAQGRRRCRSHILNPANFAAFAAWAWIPGAWLSPGQWGSESMAALWFIALGGLVTQRIQRWDVSLAFLGTWAALLAGRVLWLDYNAAVGSAMWLQQIGNGATLLFASS